MSDAERRDDRWIRNGEGYSNAALPGATIAGVVVSCGKYRPKKVFRWFVEGVGGNSVSTLGEAKEAARVAVEGRA